LKATCSGSSASMSVGNGNSYQYIYNQGYFWNGSNWENVTFSCSNLLSSSWCVGNASYTRTMSPSELANTNYYVAYVCSWTGSEWKCGCRDSTRTTNYWNLQAFKK
jgi:hypothetical protein